MDNCDVGAEVSFGIVSREVQVSKELLTPPPIRIPYPYIYPFLNTPFKPYVFSYTYYGIVFFLGHLDRESVNSKQ